MKAHIVGGGIASLAAAAHLIRDGGLPGSSIHIYDLADQMGGALDAGGSPELGYVMRGGRMFEENYRCTYDLLSFIPSISDPKKSVTEEIFSFHEGHAWHDKARLVGHDGRILDANCYGLSWHDRLDLIKLALTPERMLYGKRVSDYFTPPFFETNFWIMWASIFAFAPWYSAIEMRRYVWRFLHLFPTMVAMSGVYRTRYNQFEAIITPLVRWLGERGVHFISRARVTNIEFRPSAEEITATRLDVLEGEQSKELYLASDDVVLVAAGSMVADATRGSMTAAPELVRSKRDGSWALWETLSRRRSSFGNPLTFSAHVDESAWESFTVTCNDRIFFQLMEKFSGSEAGRGGLVTFTASNWLLTIVLFHQPHFTKQPEGVFVWWGYGLYPDRPGNYVKKRMIECSGAEILEEVLRHLNFNTALPRILASSNCIPYLLPYIGSVFMVRGRADRPAVVPHGSTNFAFLGQFTEIPGDVPFTVEYSVRSAQTAVFRLLKLDKKPPPVYQGSHDVRVLYRALKALYF